MRALTLLTVSALALATAAPAMAQDTDSSYYSVGVGYYDVISPDDSAADLRLEYRSNYDFLADDLHPWIGIEATSDASVWGGIGLLYDWNVGGNFYIIPSVGAGLYAKGSSEKDLGHVVEFRSQIEGAYQFEDQSRVGLAFGHLSNASLGDKNPGVEVVTLYYHISTDTFLSPGSTYTPSSSYHSPSMSRQAAEPQPYNNEPDPLK